MVSTQLITGITFIMIALSLPLNDFFRCSIALLAVVAISGATHDIATDGVYLSVLSSKLQAKYIGWQGAAYNIAKIVSGGAFVYMAGELEKWLKQCKKNYFFTKRIACPPPAASFSAKTVSEETSSCTIE